MEKRSKTNIDDLDRGIYDVKNEFTYSYKSESGLTEDIIRDISAKKNEPDWMLQFRLKSLELYNKIDVPTWGPDISDLNIDNIVTYVRPNVEMQSSWDDVPDDIKKTFDLLGIPEAEKKSLAGVGAQYDSEVVYHSIKEELVAQGVVYTDFESALRDYEDI
ncbi:MAG: Fe-S cluster assembly protein SufB, partial [Youngiibacter sp.]|nr:Fe-S cluster assembly protein SufB [Youngiibacter sp.]